MDLTKSVDVPKTQAQIVNIVVEMICKTQYSETGLSKWFERPAVEHTWKISKSHFTAAHTALKRIHGPDLCNKSYHQAKNMAAELNTNFERMRDEVLTRFYVLVEGQAEAPKVEAAQEEPEIMNATTEVNYQLLELIQ